MRKVIAAFNMTLDGVSDHTAGIADDELHRHYADLIRNSGVILYGRTTYQLMQYWQTLLQNPSGEKSINDFAAAIDNIQKIVFSNTLKDTGWDTAQIAIRPLLEEVLERKQQPGNDILIGSRSLIIQLLNKDLVDELQICIHPVIEGKGALLFDEVRGRIALKLINTKFFASGAAVLYYE
ncbi:MAG: dihydrofolate reductase, partial [Proteobacteria bacterium]